MLLVRRDYFSNAFHFVIFVRFVGLLRIPNLQARLGC